LGNKSVEIFCFDGTLKLPVCLAFNSADYWNSIDFGTFPAKGFGILTGTEATLFAGKVTGLFALISTFWP
jgi:hypothetical protein